MACDNSSNPIHVDMHIHTKYSGDAWIDPKRIKTCLDGIAITDHDTIEGALEARRYNKNLNIIVGEEICTDKGELIGLFLNEEIKSREFWSAVDEIRAQDGLMVLPHPFDVTRRRRIKLDDSIYDSINCVEVFNSRCVFSKSNKEASEFARKHNIVGIAGSDAHFSFEIGNAYTVFYNEDFRKALKDGKITLHCSKTNVLVHGLTLVNKVWRGVTASR